MKGLHLRGKTWWLRYQDSKGQQRLSLATNDEAEAIKKARAHLLTQIERGDLDLESYRHMVSESASTREELKRRKRPCHVYILKCADFYKVGRAMNVNYRIRELQIGNPFTIELFRLYSFPTVLESVKMEAYLHHLFDQWHHQGEWFAPPASVLSNIRESLKETLAYLTGLKYPISTDLRNL